MTVHRPLASAAASAAVAQQAADPYAEVLGYTLGQPRTAVMAIEAEIRAATAAQLPAIEDKLLKVLQTPKRPVTRKTGPVGSCSGGVRKSGGHARRIARRQTVGDGCPLGAAGHSRSQGRRGLARCAGQGPGELKAGVLQTIGSRRDRGAVAALRPWPATRTRRSPKRLYTPWDKSAAAKPWPRSSRPTSRPR